MKKILFVDDDRFFAAAYVEALRDKFEVRCVYDVETALEALRADDSLSAAIVDVMMPSPNGFEAETHDGMTTGLWIIHEAREEIEKRNLPIIVFSNRGREFVKGELAHLGLPPGLVTVSSKMAVPPFELARFVESAIARSLVRKS